MPPFVTQTRNLKPYKKAKLGAHQGAYYVRLPVYDRPGAMAAIAKRMGDREVSIESIVQRRPPLGAAGDRRAAEARRARARCLITHETTEEAIRQAIDAIERDGKVSERPQMIRIEKLKRGRREWEGIGHGRRASSPGLDRMLVLEVARVTEAAAIAAAHLRGRGQEKAADKVAVDAMRRELAKLPIRGTVVIGEGEMDEAPMLLHRREGRIGRGARGRHRGRSARGHDDLRQGDAQCARRAGDLRARRPFARARHLHEQDRDRPGLPAGRRRSRCPARRQHRGAGEGEGRAGRRDHRLHPRPAAPRRADRGRAQGRCRRAAHSRRRHRGRHLDDRPGRDRHRHLSGLGRCARRRAGGGGAALHRRPDAGAAAARVRRAARARRRRWASPTSTGSSSSRTWPRPT